MKTTLITLLSLLSLGVQADSLNSQFQINLKNSDHVKADFQVLATDSIRGVVKHNVSIENGLFCLGILGLDEDGFTSLYYPGYGQAGYQGNCHNYSFEIDLKGKKLIRFEVGEELETVYKGISTFGFEREVVIKRIK